GVVDDKVHELVDESWSLGADPAFGEDRRVLTGRALALAAALDWPAAAEEAAAVLDGVLRKTPLRADAILARAAVFLLAGDAGKAVTLTRAAKAIPDVPPRVHYLLARALLAQGKQTDGLAELERYREPAPDDAVAPRRRPRAARRPCASRRPKIGPRWRARPTTSPSAGRSTGGSTTSWPRPTRGCWWGSPPAASCARTARPSAPAPTCWSSAPPPARPRRSAGRRRATSSPPPS